MAYENVLWIDLFMLYEKNMSRYFKRYFKSEILAVGRKFNVSLCWNIQWKSWNENFQKMIEFVDNPKTYLRKMDIGLSETLWVECH